MEEKKRGNSGKGSKDVKVTNSKSQVQPAGHSISIISKLPTKKEKALLND